MCFGHDTIVLFRELIITFFLLTLINKQRVSCLSPAVYLRKISDEEHPLRLRLATGPDEKLLSFVLKENETGEVNVSTISVLGDGR